MQNQNKAPQGLDGVLMSSKNAQRYFSSLPPYVQEMIIQRRENIRSESDLRSYADNITQGDK